MAEGVSREMNFMGPLEAFRQGLQGVRDEAARPIEIPVHLKVEGGGAAAIGDGRSAPEGILPRQEDLALRPSPRRYRSGGAWDSPDDYSDAGGNGLRASEGWDKILSGGAYHTLSESGRFGRTWGTFLDDDRGKQQRDWADAAASPEGRSYMGSMEDAEKLGKRVAVLMREIGQGGTGAVKAAEELKKAQQALEEVGKAGKMAAEGIGGEMGGRLRSELSSVVSQGLAGQMPGEDESGGFRLTPRGILSMIRNPYGTAMQGMTSGAEGLLGMLGPAALGFAGGVGAGVGGAILGYKFLDHQSDKTLSDAATAGDDLLLSRDLGNKFDFRGKFWNKERNNAEFGVDSIGARSVLRGLGIGLDNYQGDAKHASQYLISSSYEIGVDPSVMSGFVGNAMKGGAADRSDAGVFTYLARISGYLERTADAGVTHGESLRAIAALNSQQVQALGRLSEGASNYNMNLTEALSKTGDPALLGEQGASRVASRLGSPLQGNQLPMVFGLLAQDKDRWKKVITDRYGPDRARDILSQSLPAQFEELKEDPGFIEFARRGALGAPQLAGLEMPFRQRLTGGSMTPSELRSMDRSGLLSWDKIDLSGVEASHKELPKELQSDFGNTIHRLQTESYSKDNARSILDMQTAEAFRVCVSDFGQWVTELGRSYSKSFSEDVNSDPTWKFLRGENPFPPSGPARK